MIAFSRTLLSFLICCIFAMTAHADDPDWITHVGIRNLDIPEQTFRANDYGAVADGETLNTEAIQRAVNACAAEGGGKVVFDKGSYHTGSIFLKSNVQLHIDEGVELLGSQDLKDYPEIWTRVAGVEMLWPAALVNIIGQRNAAVTGKGIIDGQGKPFWDAYWALRKEYESKKLRWIVDYDAKRPRTLLVDGCWDILIEDITFRRAGFWTVHILYSSYVTIDGITVQNNIGGHGPSTDGIDIDSSSWILVQNADIDCNDDNFCIKSGRDWDGLRINRPTEYVLIQNCISRKGGGLITFGSETSGGMRYIMARNLKAQGTKVGIRFKSARNRGGVVEDIYLQNITMDSVGVAIEITPNWNPSYSYSELPEGYDYRTLPDHWRAMLEPVLPASRGIPTFRNIYIDQVNCQDARKAIFADGLVEKPLQGFHLKAIQIRAREAGKIQHAKDWSFDQVVIEAADGNPLKITDSDNVEL
ncbi:glycoside hydrolase family 28 protein [Parapedobacter tibetensis]|uniref:glycoside hydrolase family 28 protein n=1 Tax=Parapedobacter tibetensis TaxID=2972951 RepID=UPI00214DA022|nr:glycoside hydrolase family 28 protein [Parapedobacter tibetensis]